MGPSLKALLEDASMASAQLVTISSTKDHVRGHRTRYDA